MFIVTGRLRSTKVLYVIDVYGVQQLKDFDGNKLSSMTKEGLDTG